MQKTRNLNPGDLVVRMTGEKKVKLGFLVEPVKYTDTYPIWYVLNGETVDVWAENNILKVG